MQNDTVVGFLADALSCVVTEERNGVFELSLTYPVTGQMFPEIEIDRFVKAKPNDTADLQLFHIYEVSKPMNGVVTVNAEHVSYALSNFPVTYIHITGTATQAINAVLSDVPYDLDYFDKVNPFMAATTDMDALERVSLCDWVTIRHLVLGIDMKAQVVKTVYDTIGCCIWLYALMQHPAFFMQHPAAKMQHPPINIGMNNRKTAQRSLECAPMRRFRV